MLADWQVSAHISPWQNAPMNLHVRKLPYEIASVSSLIGEVVSIDEWAQRAQLPSRHGAGALDGATLKRLLGIEGKSWDPKLFADMDASVVRTARAALASARVRPSDLEAVIVVTSTPYEVMFDQDAFRLMRALGVPDHVPPIQLGSGCAGLARAMTVASQLRAGTVLVVAYCLASLVTGDGEGGVGAQYRKNEHHPCGRTLWSSPALFSDAACALVLRRSEKQEGAVVYSRDSLRFGDEAGFPDPLMHYPGGAGRHPTGTPNADAYCCYGMSAPHIKRYYEQGMLLNHQALSAVDPEYGKRVRRIYTHQASPALVSHFQRTSGLPEEKMPTNVREFGNLVSPCTMKLLDDDLAQGRVAPDDLVCVSVVGGGPERGAFFARLRIESV